MEKEAEVEAIVISFINLKGGVGKTSATINIADELSKEKKVLVIDMDPQFNATQALLNHQLSNKRREIPKELLSAVEKDFNENYEKNIKESNEKEDKESIEKTKFDIKSQIIYNKLKESKMTAKTLFTKDAVATEIASPDLIYRIKENLYLVSGDLDLFETLNGDTAGKHNVLEDHFKEFDLRNTFDYILIDCPPNWTILTQASLFVSDYYIIPSKIDLFSSIGIGLLQSLVESTFHAKSSSIFSMYNMFRSSLNKPSIRPIGVLFTLTHDMVISEVLKSRLIKELKNLKFLESEIPYQSSVPLKFSLYSEAGDKYRSLTNALEKVVLEIDGIIEDNLGGEIDEETTIH